MAGLLVDAAQRADGYLRGLAQRPVAPSAAALANLEGLDRPLQEQPLEADQVLQELDEFGSPATTASAGGRFFGFVVGGSLPVTVAANFLATAWDQNAGLEILSPAAAALERVARGWLVSLLGLPPETEAGFVSGATMANFVGLATARHSLLQRLGWDVEARGLFGAPPLTVVVGDEVHVSLLKALSLLGLGRDSVVRVSVDGQGRMIADRLPAIVGPTIVCLQAGNVNSGSFDPIGEICTSLAGTDAWVHVDGAFGLWAAASPSKRALIAGFEQADSWATDAHKWLNVPYDSGLVFVGDPRALNASMAASAAYLIEGERRDPHLYVPEMSRRARGVEVWAALRSLGTSGLAAMIDRSCAHARRFAAGLSEAGHEILNEVVLNQVLVSFGTPERTRQVIAGIQKDGTCWCGGTVWQGRTAMRISVSSWATTEEDVERSLEAMVRVAAQVERDGR
jgi:glutamate/tyrosine decarboxylase-like PLP-dependent enzyme